ncbi:MAG: response regulator [Alphaproteobacteria bacterium]|nr:MAG: response regulator [Alphaproteobacteria bacterium]
MTKSAILRPTLEQTQFGILGATFLAATVVFLGFLNIKNSGSIDLSTIAQTMQNQLVDFEHEIIAYKSDRGPTAEHFRSDIVRHRNLISQTREEFDAHSFYINDRLYESLDAYQKEYELNAIELEAFLQNILSYKQQTEAFYQSVADTYRYLEGRKEESISLAIVGLVHTFGDIQFAPPGDIRSAVQQGTDDLLEAARNSSPRSKELTNAVVADARALGETMAAIQAVNPYEVSGSNSPAWLNFNKVVRDTLKSRKSRTDLLGSLLYVVTAAFAFYIVILLLRLVRVGRDQSRLTQQLINANSSLEAKVKSRTEELKTATDEAIAANQAKSNFLATMSHEIRTPMNGIIGMTQALLQESLPEKHRTQVETIQQSGQVLLELLNDILDLSKIEAGQIKLETIPFTLRQLETQSRALWQSLTEAKGLSFSWDSSGDKDLKVMGDPNRTQQVISNLISNALKFTQSGKISVKARIENEGNGHRLYFIVRDTGIGVPKAAQDRIFDKFSQADESTTRNYGGTGLGLAISKELVSRMGGEIDFSSSEGEGSQFYFDIFCGKADQTAAEKVDGALNISAWPQFTSASHPLNIIVAEDNKVNRQVLNSMLSRTTAQLHFVDNGYDVIEALEQGPVDLILMDVQMPYLDGLETTRRIRQRDDHLRDVKIIALTANALADDRERCEAAGMDAYIAKPVSLESLLRTIAATLELGQAAE